jgi:hypothetical protein
MARDIVRHLDTDVLESARPACILRLVSESNRRHLLRKLENVDAFPLIALQAIHELRTEFDELEARAIIRARELGASLEDIGEALEITRQGVAYKMKMLAERPDPDVIDLRDGESESAADRDR